MKQVLQVAGAVLLALLLVAGYGQVINVLLPYNAAAHYQAHHDDACPYCLRFLESGD